MITEWVTNKKTPEEQMSDFLKYDECCQQFDHLFSKLCIGVISGTISREVVKYKCSLFIIGVYSLKTIHNAYALLHLCGSYLWGSEYEEISTTKEPPRYLIDTYKICKRKYSKTWWRKLLDWHFDWTGIWRNMLCLRTSGGGLKTFSNTVFDDVYYKRRHYYIH